MSGQSNQKHRYMSDGAVVLGGLKADHGGCLHGDSQEPGKDPFDRCSLFMYVLKPLTVVIDLRADRRA